MRLIYLVVVIMCINNSLFAIEYNQYDMNVVKEYEASQSNLDIEPLRVNFHHNNPEPSGPMIYFKNETLVIADQNANRTISLTDDYTFDKKYNFSFSNEKIHQMNDYILGFDQFDGIHVSYNWNLIVRVSFDYIEVLRYSQSAFYHSNILFVHDENGKLWSIKNPGLDDSKNRKNLLNEDKTLDLFKNGDIDGLTIDSEKRLFLNGELQTLDYAVFYKYYKGLHPEGKLSLKLDTQVTDEASSSMRYIGKDNEGNYYWRLGQKHMSIFNYQGFLIEIFKYDRKKVSTTPAVSPPGDIYFMHHGEEKVTLYKIDRQW